MKNIAHSFQRKTSICLFILSMYYSFLQGQDTIYRADGVKQIVKILELNTEQLMYKDTTELKDSIHTISKERIIKVVYLNGVIDSFPPKSHYQFTKFKKEDLRKTDFGRNFISLHLIDLLYSSITISYEHLFKSNKLSLRIPVSIGFTIIDLPNEIDNNGYYNMDKNFSVGLDLYIYPFGQGKVKFFYGPSIEYGQMDKKVFSYTSPNYFLNYKGSFYSLILESGYLIQPTKHFNFSVNAGIGWTSISLDYSIYDTSKPQLTLRYGLSVGYKF